MTRATNKKPGTCRYCRKPVGIGEGVNTRARGAVGGWAVAHEACEKAAWDRLARAFGARPARKRKAVRS